MLIINADDFGASETINQSIVMSFEQGWCSSATIIPNYPAVDEAFELAHDRGLIDKLGVHINLVTQMPLTDAMARQTRLCHNGMFSSDWRNQYSRGIQLDSTEQEAVANEIRAQINRCLHAKIAVTHVDSHTHAHTIPGIAAIVQAVAREFHIPAIRLARNSGHPSSLPKALYKCWFNYQLRRRRFTTTDYFGDIDDALITRQKHPQTWQKHWEIMVHPDNCHGRILDAEGDELAIRIAKIPEAQHAVSYAQLSNVMR